MEIWQFRRRNHRINAKFIATSYLKRLVFFLFLDATAKNAAK